MQTTGRRRGLTAAVLAATVLLAPAAGVGGYAAARQLSGAAEPTAAPAAPPTTLPTAVPSASAPADATATASPDGVPSELSAAARELAARATVRLSPPSGYYVGSGSLVSADGLVLTNGHVAQPTAPGLALQYGPVELPETDPGFLVVSTTDGDGPATPTYRADVLAVDGHLDLAVLRISARADGRPLPADLQLPFVPVGSVQDLSLGDDLTVYGFPTLNTGDHLTVRRGEVGAFLPDPFGRVAGDRYTIESSADFSGGNSGGMGLSNDGRLVGVPSSVLTTEELVRAHNLRAVDLAAPLLEGARAGTPYRSPFVTAGTGGERGEDLGWSEDPDCSAPGQDVLDGSATGAVGRVRLDGFAADEDVLLVLSGTDGVLRVLATTYDPAQSCLTMALPVDDEGRLVSDAYQLEVLAGPDRTPVVRSSVAVEGAGG